MKDWLRLRMPFSPKNEGRHIRIIRCERCGGDASHRPKEFECCGCRGKGYLVFDKKNGGQVFDLTPKDYPKEYTMFNGFGDIR